MRLKTLLAETNSKRGGPVHTGWLLACTSPRNRAKGRFQYAQMNRANRARSIAVRKELEKAYCGDLSDNYIANDPNWTGRI